MGGWGGWGGMMGGFGLFSWLFGLLFSLGLLVLLILLIVWLVRQVTTPRGGVGGTSVGGSHVPPTTPGRTCPTCGRPVGADWTVCPYDGTPLA